MRREVPADVDAVREVHRRAFSGAAGTDVEVRLLDALRDAGDVVAALTLVAEVDGQVVGSVVTSPATVTDADPRRVVALGPVGVLPEHQGSGVGTALLHAVLGAAQALDEPVVVLLGAPEFYGRFGFEPASAHGITPPEPQWGRFFQVRVFGSAPRGAFRYAPAFDLV